MLPVSFLSRLTSLVEKAIDSALLRSDHNVLLIQLDNEMVISIYPSGGYGIDGEPYNDISGIIALLQGSPELAIGGPEEILDPSMMSMDDMMGVDVPMPPEPENPMVVVAEPVDELPTDIQLDVMSF